jgi:hypothetical protein
VALGLASLVACSTWQGFWNPPRRLLDQAQAAVEQREHDTAYRKLAEIRERYPTSAESPEAFRRAALIFKKRYYENRLTRPDSPWVTSEARFMLDWFAAFLAGPEFPQAEAEALFLGMPYSFFREYLALAQTDPRLSRWAIQAPDDNGIIEAIVAERAAR